MSFDLKSRKWYHSNQYKKFPRKSVNRTTAGHLSMRYHGRGKLFFTKRPSEIPVRIIYKFLSSRVNQSVDTVRKDFVELANKHHQTELTGRTIDYWLRFEDNLDIGSKKFYNENGVLKRASVAKKRVKKVIKSHIKYNKKNIDSNSISRLKESYNPIMGPVFIGKLWVVWKGNHMLLPVYVVNSLKLTATVGKNYTLYEERFMSFRFTKDSLDHLKDMITVGLEGLFSYKDDGIVEYITVYRGSHNLHYYNFVVYKRDIENYKKEKAS